MTAPHFTPTLAQVITRAINARLADVRVALPAHVEAFDPVTQLARVKPLLRESFEAEDGAEVSESLPVISDVPVQFPGAGGFVLTFPVKAGDPCWLVFSDRALDKWIASGAEVDPVDLRRHNLSDAVAMLGVRSKAGALAEFDAVHAWLGSAGGVGVSVREREVHLGVTHGANAVDAVALASKVEARLSALEGAMNAHVHPVPNAVPAGPPPVLATALAVPIQFTAGAVASSIVKAE
jgi:hypothetical protein